MGRRPESDEAVFPNRFGQPTRWDHPAEAFRKDLVAAGCSDQVDGIVLDLHSARRFFATELDRIGVADAVRKRLMGHRITDVTQAHYTRAGAAELLPSVARLPLVWNGPVSST